MLTLVRGRLPLLRLEEDLILFSEPLLCFKIYCPPTKLPANPSSKKHCHICAGLIYSSGRVLNYHVNMSSVQTQEGRFCPVFLYN